MRINLAHTGLLTSVLLLGATGCGASHERDDDAGPILDAGPATDASPGDAGSPRDAGTTTTSCAADDAREAVCPDALCDGLPRWYWNGDSCFWTDCGACVGADCARGFGSEDACMGAHAGCESTLCRGTGGTWRWWAEECGHLVCGISPPIDCFVGQPICDCGILRRFDPALGCVDEPSCPVPETGTKEELCGWTGGSWENICCDTECGAFCPDACVNPACNCGEGQVFEDGVGCVESERCHDRRANETCEGLARCEEGTICCQSCGGAGCFGPPTCIAPVCDDNPDIDECGNNRLAP